MYKSLVSKLFRSTAETKAEPDPLEESRSVMTLFAILGNTGILCSFSLAVEKITGKYLNYQDKSSHRGL